MNGWWILAAFVVVETAIIARMAWKIHVLSLLMTERTSTIIKTVREQEHTAIPHNRFMHPPSQPLIHVQRHSVPISMPLNLPIIDPWDDLERGN